MSVLGRHSAAVRWAAGLCIAIGARAHAQQGIVSGRITDEGTRQPVAGVWVQVVGTSVSAQTTEQGSYTIRLSPGSYQLRAVRVGYAAQAPRTVVVRAGEATTADWVLKAAPYTLEGVVVTATGEQLSRELGNTVGRVDAAQ